MIASSRVQHRFRLGKRANDLQSLLPRCGTELHVSTGKCEAIGFANGLATDDLDAETHVAIHLTNHRKLLKILLPEHREMRPRSQKKLRNGFPDALDLMVVCIESGLGLAQAIQRVAEELSVSHPELSEEMALVNAEMRVGIENTVALRNLGDRTGLDDVRALVSTLVQTLRFGTSVADALRVYAAEFRDKRMQAAEERAAKMGVKMIFPLVFFMFPGFFLIAIGPAVIQLIKAFQYTS